MSSKIFDCFMYNNEDLLLDIRLNILDKYVDYFVIVESRFLHSGKEKKDFFNVIYLNNQVISSYAWRIKKRSW